MAVFSYNTSSGAIISIIGDLNNVVLRCAD